MRINFGSHLLSRSLAGMCAGNKRHTLRGIVKSQSGIVVVNLIDDSALKRYVANTHVCFRHLQIKQMGHTGVVALRIGTAPEQTLYVPLVADYLLEYIFLRTSLGLKPTDPSPVPPALLSAHHLVYDLQTHDDAFQMEARFQGARVSNGLSMLVHQGALSFERWFGIKPDISAMRQALEQKHD